MSEADRIAALSARADALFVRVSKAAARGPKRPRVPGDGDGDGIAYEGRKKPGAAGAPKKSPSLIDVLNNPEGRRLVEAIEDTMSSLEGKKSDKVLGNVLRAQAQELKDRFGFDHYGAKELVQQHLGAPSPAPVAPAPGTKWSSHAVMVHPQTGQRTVVPRSSAKNFPESEGWKEVGPGVKTPKPTKR